MYDKKIIDDLTKNWNSYYKKKLNFEKLTLEEREAFLKLLSIEYISGRNLLEILYNIPFVVYKYLRKIFNRKYNYPYKNLKLNFVPFSYI